MNCSKTQWMGLVYCLILSAVKLRIFDVLKTPKSIDEIAEELECNNKKLLYVLCKVKSKGLVLEEYGMYENSEIADEFLTYDSFFSQCMFIENTFGNIKLWLKLPEMIKQCNKESKGCIKIFC